VEVLKGLYEELVHLNDNRDRNACKEWPSVA
jgi:hypothetical protein